MSVWIAAWGVLGVAALVLRALVALTPMALEPILDGSLGAGHWTLMAGWVAFNAYAEGYVGFHLKFSPRVVSRALQLGRHPSPLRVILAAPYCIGLFGAPKKTIATSWTLVLGIAALVVWVRHLSQPWRGILDAGVVVGLGIGLLSLLFVFIRAVSPPDRDREQTLKSDVSFIE